ncbi:MAG: hypothetical protein ACR2N7_11895, partial [Acidimicrobiia bacterium]
MSDLMDLEVGIPLFETASGTPSPNSGLKSLKQLRHEKLLLLPYCPPEGAKLQGVRSRYCNWYNEPLWKCSLMPLPDGAAGAE